MKQFDINNIDKQNPFRVPEGYFEGLTARVMAQIPETTAAPATEREEAQVIQMPAAKKNNRWIGWSVAAAACIAGLVFMRSLNSEVTMHHNLTAQTETVAEPSYDEEYQQEVMDYAMVDNYDVYQYLAGNF